MEKQERSGAKTTVKSRANKSFINVKMFEPINKKIIISSDSNDLLLNYIEFLNSSAKRNINADAVIEALIEKLHEDKNFKAWLSLKSKSETVDKTVTV